MSGPNSLQLHPRAEGQVDPPRLALFDPPRRGPQEEQADQTAPRQGQGCPDQRARQVFFDGEVPRFQVVIPDFGTVEGSFQITSLEYAGSYNGEATFEMSMASAGALTFVAASGLFGAPEDYVGDGGDQPPPIEE